MKKKHSVKNSPNTISRELATRVLAHQINNAPMDVLVGAFAHLGFRMNISLVPVFGMPENPQPSKAKS